MAKTVNAKPAPPPAPAPPPPAPDQDTMPVAMDQVKSIATGILVGRLIGKHHDLTDTQAMKKEIHDAHQVAFEFLNYNFQPADPEQEPEPALNPLDIKPDQS
jgi:hypothetical protein